MDRTFHQRVTIGAVCGILLTLSLAVYAFWTKDIILGLLMTFFLLIISERTLHSEYKFHDDKLIIYHGRLSKTKIIHVNTIYSCRPMSSVFGIIRYLLVTYGNHQIVSLQPDNEPAFIEVLRKRQLKEKKDEEQDNN